MSTQQRLEKTRQDLELFKQQVQQDAMVNQNAYEDRLKLIRQMGDVGDAPQDATTAMALVQYNIERKIAELEQEANNEAATIQVPAQQITVPAADAENPPEAQQAQKPGMMTRMKNWFKRRFSKSNDGANNGGADNGDNGGDATPPVAPVDNIAIIRNMNVASRIGEMQRFQKANPDDEGICTPEEMKKMQQSNEGARGGAGNFIPARSAMLTAPMRQMTVDMFNKLTDDGFDFAQANQECQEKAIGIGLVNVSPAIVSVVNKVLDNWIAALDNEHFQETVKMFYTSCGASMMKIVRRNDPNAMPTADDFDDHVMQFMPSRCMESFRNQFTRTDTSDDCRTFTLNCQKLFGKLGNIADYMGEHPEDAELMQPLMDKLNQLRAKISEVGGDARDARLNELTRELNSQGAAPQ